MILNLIKNLKDSADQKSLFDFLNQHSVFTLSSIEGDKSWNSIFYYVVDEEGKIYFISRKKSKHGEDIKKNPNVSFSVFWFDKNNHFNRKAVQGAGKCRLCNKEESERIFKKFQEKLPDFCSTMTLDWLLDKSNDATMWVVEPEFIKYLNDERFGKKEFKGFFKKEN